MAALYANLDVLIVSVFCAGGLYAYLREALRLDGLLRNGRIVSARILKTETDDSGSESIKHYLVTYEFVNEAGGIETHKQDLNDETLFRRLNVGDSLEILTGADGSGNSYPVSAIRSDRRLSWYIAGAIVVFWAAMSVYFLK
jgi:hypothetical protein